MQRSPLKWTISKANFVSKSSWKVLINEFFQKPTNKINFAACTLESLLQQSDACTNSTTYSYCIVLVVHFPGGHLSTKPNWRNEKEWHFLNYCTKTTKTLQVTASKTDEVLRPNEWQHTKSHQKKLGKCSNYSSSQKCSSFILYAFEIQIDKFELFLFGITLLSRDTSHDGH